MNWEIERTTTRSKLTLLRSFCIPQLNWPLFGRKNPMLMRDLYMVNFARCKLKHQIPPERSGGFFRAGPSVARILNSC